MIKRIVSKFFIGLGVFSFLLILYGVGLGIYVWKNQKTIDPKTVLKIDFNQEFVEYIPEDSIAASIDSPPKVLDIVNALEKAAADDRVVALLCHIGNPGMGLARTQEIRDAIIAFRSAGKPTIAYTDTFGEFAPGNGDYYLATACETIYLQPSGDVMLTGLMFENLFIKETLNKIGVAPRLDQRHEYKNYMNMFTETEFTEPHREALEKIMTSFVDQVVQDIADARNMTKDDVQKIMDQGVFLGQQAKDANLVDEIAYRDNVYEKLKELYGSDATVLSAMDYLDQSDKDDKEAETIALIYGVGGVQRGDTHYNPVFESIVMGSATVTEAFREAVKDDAVKAILFRVDSPGGSYVASDTIWREVIRAKEAGKPVIVSMGDVAGSGGYFVAMAANKIVAHPSTITGSIGVLGGKMLFSELWNKIGITWDEVHSNAKSTMWSFNQDYTPEQWQAIQSLLDRIYDDFTKKVADGRNLPIETVLEIAKGRIWTGSDAKNLGLVDALGGFPVAIRLAKEAADISEETTIRLKEFPARKSFIEQIIKKLSGNKPVIMMKNFLGEPLTGLVMQIGKANNHGALTLPESELSF